MFENLLGHRPFRSPVSPSLARASTPIYSVGSVVPSGLATNKFANVAPKWPFSVISAKRNSKLSQPSFSFVKTFCFFPPFFFFSFHPWFLTSVDTKSSVVKQEDHVRDQTKCELREKVVKNMSKIRTGTIVATGVSPLYDFPAVRTPNLGRSALVLAATGESIHYHPYASALASDSALNRSKYSDEARHLV